MDKKPIHEIVSGDDLLNIVEWAQQLGYLENEIFGIIGMIPKNEKGTLEYWFKNKTSIEGFPDPSVVDEIGLSGKIEKPIILDSDREYCIEGRHRLAAAIKYDLDCPVVDILLIKEY